MSSLADALTSTGMIPPMSGNDIQQPETPANQNKPDTPKTSEMSVVSEDQKKVEEGVKKLDAINPPPPPQFKEAPKFETTDSAQQGYVAAIGIMGAIGSAFTRRPMVNSMNSAAAVVNAMKKGDQQAFEQNMEKWKIDNENIKALSEYQQGIYKDILDSTTRSTEEKMGLLTAHAAAFNDDAMLAQAGKRDEMEAQRLVLDREKAQKEWDVKKDEAARTTQEWKTKQDLYNEAVKDKNYTPEQKANIYNKIMDPSVAAAAVRAETEVEKEKQKTAPQKTEKTDNFGFENSATPAAVKANEAVDVEDRKKERNVPIYADRIMSSLENVKPQIDKFPTGASSGVRNYLMKAANLGSFGQLFPTVATAGDLMDKNLYNVVLDYTNLVQNTGMRGTNLQLQTNIKGKPGPELMKEANRSIVNEIEGNTQDVNLRYEAKNVFRENNPLGYADERVNDVYDGLKAKYPLLTQQKDKQGNVLMQYHPENAEKIKELIPDAIAHPEKYDSGGEKEKPPVEGAKKADDGNWYLPDPKRPGKYLKVTP